MSKVLQEQNKVSFPHLTVEEYLCLMSGTSPEEIAAAIEIMRRMDQQLS